MIALSISDQSHIFGDQTAQEALQNSIKLAQMADTYGYTRFWVAEHHNNPFMACASPEILATAIAARTHHIRVGAGGVMLPNYSAFKVAEMFRLLHTLFPNRIDLGIGRGPGADAQTCQVLNPAAKHSDLGLYAQQIRDLVGFLTHSLPADHPHRQIRAMPEGPGTPEVWMLGMSPTSVEIAASQGLAFCFAQFMSKGNITQIMETYQQCFQPSRFLQRPRASMAVQVLCMEDEEEALRLAWNLFFLMAPQQKKMAIPGEAMFRLPSKEAVASYTWTEEDIASMQHSKLPFIVGNVAQVKEKLMELAKVGGVDELVINTFYPDFAIRVRSYQLLAEAFSLPRREN